jgi:hypothetical protein
MDMFKFVIGWALLIALGCALSGGITYNGVHHGISCSCERGVGIE